ncbi:MAG: hypothetical protein RLZZ373_3742, partial [Pseudomonadota bacterium]
TVIDIGVANGTPWLYDAFPRAKFVLIDPHPAAALGSLGDQLNADIYPHAVGAQAGQLILHKDIDVPSSSSCLPVSDWLEETRGARASTDVTVQVCTLDHTLGSRYRAPYLLKIDTEGFEMEVLKGAERTLEATGAVIAECSVAPRFTGSYEAAELIGYLADRGFRLYDLLNVRTIGRTGPINYLDAVFVRPDVVACHRS